MYMELETDTAPPRESVRLSRRADFRTLHLACFWRNLKD